MFAVRTFALAAFFSALTLSCGEASPRSDANGPSGTGGATSHFGCQKSQSAYPLGTTEGSLGVSDGRTFRVHVPPTYRAGNPAPVVLMFHGGGGSALQFQTASARMDSIADREGFITVYPDGTGALATWNGGVCCGRAVDEQIDDVAFVDALLDHLEEELCIDERRVFASGMSNGAILCHRLACELSERIAAIAPVAGTLGIDNCAPPRPVPVMQIHGTEDGHVPWEGGVGCGPSGASFMSVPTTMETWRMHNQCAADEVEIFTQGNGNCTAYEECSAPVVLCAIEGGGHSWPGGVPSSDVVDCPTDGPQSQTFSASEAAWQFFSENPAP